MWADLLLPIVAVVNVLVFGLLFAVGFLVVRKLLRDLKAPEDLPLAGRVMDELEVIQLQLRALGERIERIENRLPAPAAAPDRIGPAERDAD